MNHDRCLQCLSPLNTNAGWEALFSWKKQKLCDECEEKLQSLAPPWCVHCSRPLDVTESCGDCERWAQTRHWSGLLTRNVSLFLYDEHLQEVLSAYKYRGDVELAKMFTEPLRQSYRKHFKDTIPVPIPLSEERWQERGFNQAAVLAGRLPVVYKPLLMRTVDEAKQSKRSRQGRLRGHVRPFAVHEKVESLSGQHILLIDDIYTTGTTLRKAAIPLLNHGAGRVSALTVARS